MTTADSFWERVAISGYDECWEWLGARTSANYGNLVWGGRNWLAHRVSYALSSGVYPGRHDVILHSCDNPPCVNPRHLSIGTMADNVRDMHNKGRAAKYDRSGERNPRATISEDDAARVVGMLSSGYSAKDVATKMGISRRVVVGIRSGKTWPHLTKDLDVSLFVRKSGNMKLSVKEVYSIKAMIARGDEDVRIASVYRVHLATIKRIRSGVTWGEVEYP